jgi:hypothetical protein
MWRGWPWQCGKQMHQYSSRREAAGVLAAALLVVIIDNILHSVVAILAVLLTICV